MLRKLILAAAVASSVLAGGVAIAQAAPPSSYPAARGDAPPPRAKRPHGMMRADRNGDGIVTRQEAIAEATRKFDKLDRNRDGKLTADEIPQRGQRGARRGQRGGGDMQAPPPARNGY